MLLKDEREQIVYFGKKLITANLTKGTGGNLSIYNEKEGLMAIKPSGIEYMDITPEDVVVMDFEGHIIESKRKPSSEYLLHKIFYENRKNIKSIVHTHSTYATTLSCLQWDLPAIHYLIAFSGQDRVRCTPYVPFGSKELSELAFHFMENNYAVLLGNHGLLTAGPNIDYAFSATEEIDVTINQFSAYGQKVK